MRRNKRKLSRVEALARVSTAPVVKINAPYERGTGLQKFTRQYEVQIAAEEQARKDAAERPIRAAEQQLTESLKALRAQHAAALLAGTSDDLLSRCTQITDDDVIENGAPISIEVVRVRITNALDTIVLKLEDEGIRITADGRQKLRGIARQERNRSINWMDASNWQALFIYADDLAILNDRDVTRTQVAPQPAVVEQPPDLLAEMEAQPDTHEGRKRARELGNQHLFSVEAKCVFDEWLASLSNNFDFVPTEAEQRAAIDLSIERNLSFLNRKHYDDVRKAMVARGIFPERCLTNSDRAALLVENSPAQTYGEKQELKRKLALLNG